MKSPTQRMEELLRDGVLQTSITPILESRLRTLLHDSYQDCMGDCAEFVRTSLGPPRAGGSRDKIAQSLRYIALDKPEPEEELPLVPERCLH